MQKSNVVEMDPTKVVGYSGEGTNLKGKVSPEEWELRCELATLYRAAALMKWDDLIFTHFTLRIPGPERHFLINPFGYLFEEVTPSNLVKVDHEGHKVDDSPYPVNPAGFAIHAAVHLGREDAHCVMHLHTDDGSGVSAQDEGLLPLTQQSMIVCNDLAYYEYGGPGQTGDEGLEIAKAMGNHNFGILRSHGTLAIGQTCGDTFMRMYFLERACSMQIRTQAGEKVRKPNQGVPELMADSLRSFDGALGRLAWPAIQRRVARTWPDYLQ
jgi:ribulose-5-phosphate 4-epimerase/fuculose-1-phosphate aldolase